MVIFVQDFMLLMRLFDKYEADQLCVGCVSFHSKLMVGRECWMLLQSHAKNDPKDAYVKRFFVRLADTIAAVKKVPEQFQVCEKGRQETFTRILTLWLIWMVTLCSVAQSATCD